MMRPRLSKEHSNNRDNNNNLNNLSTSCSWFHFFSVFLYFFWAEEVSELEIANSQSKPSQPITNYN